MKKIDRITNNLKEMLTANPPGQSGGFSSESNPEGATAGFSSVLDTYRRKKSSLYDMISVPKKYRRWIVGEIINT